VIWPTFHRKTAENADRRVCSELFCLRHSTITLHLLNSSRDSLVGCKPGWVALTSYQHLRMDNLPRLKPSSQLLLLYVSNHPGRIPRHDCIRWNTPGDDCPCAHHGIPAYPHPWQEDGTAP
jgi:hypothetical protein